jgi:hypothetical protein
VPHLAGSIRCPGPDLVSIQSRLVTSAPTRGAAAPVTAHMSTLTIGHVLLQVFSTNFVLADAGSLPAYDANPPQPHAQALSRIWPIWRSRLQWPPSTHISPEVWTRSQAGASQRSPSDTYRCLPAVDLASVLAPGGERT